MSELNCFLRRAKIKVTYNLLQSILLPTRELSEALPDRPSFLRKGSAGGRESDRHEQLCCTTRGSVHFPRRVTSAQTHRKVPRSISSEQHQIHLSGSEAQPLPNLRSERRTNIRCSGTDGRYTRCEQGDIFGREDGCHGFCVRNRERGGMLTRAAFQGLC